MAAISCVPSEAADRATALRQIVACESDRSLCDGKLAALLDSPDSAIAARAALGIGRTRNASGLQALRLADGRDGVRAMSVYAAGLLGGTTQLLDSRTRLIADRSSAVRFAFADAAERLAPLLLHDDRATIDLETSLATMLRSDGDARVRARAATALAPFADGAAGLAAERALVGAFRTDRSQDVRVHVMWTIFRKYAVQVPRPVLTAALHDSNELVRVEAVRAYGRLKNADAIAALQPLLNDASWRVAEQAVESIKTLQKQPATEHLAAVPSNVRLPAIPPDPYATLAAQPRQSPPSGKPTVDRIEADLVIDPHAAADMLGPVHGMHPRIRIVTTKGNLYFALFPEWAPLTVENFLNLSDRGFFDRNPWFRIVPDFVVQTGEQDAKATPGPGYAIPAELNPMEQMSDIISMGLDYDEKTATPLLDSAGSEYYVTLSPQLHLNLPFTVFGRLLSGAAVLAHLTESDSVIRIERLDDIRL